MSVHIKPYAYPPIQHDIETNTSTNHSEGGRTREVGLLMQAPYPDTKWQAHPSREHGTDVEIIDFSTETASDTSKRHPRSWGTKRPTIFCLLAGLCPKSIDGASLAVGRFPAKLGPTTHEMACLLGGLKIGLPG